MPAIDTVNQRNQLLESVDNGGTTAMRVSYDSQISQIGLTYPYTRYLAELGQTLRQHPMFYVSPEMAEVARGAAISLQESDEVFELEPYDLPSHRGFLYLPGGLPFEDIRGEILVHHAVAWWREGPDALCMSWFTSKRDMRDQVNKSIYEREPDLWALLDDLGFSHFYRVPLRSFNTHSKGIYLTMADGSPLEKDIQFEFSPTGGGKAMSWSSATGDYVRMWRQEPFQGEIPPSERNWLDPQAEGIKMERRSEITPPFLYAVWQLMRQTVTDLAEVEPDRATRRRSQRLNADSKVTVIELRKRESTRTDKETEVEWSHRWVRRGHWRRQPYKDEEGTWRRKVIYIFPTVCGPEDKPLVIREHVNALVR